MLQFLMQEREKSWFASSLKSRLQYLGPSPGLPCLSEEPDPEFLDPSKGPVGAFCVLILDPDQVSIFFSLIFIS
jgi:pyridoxamine 5'-phosphate oxidase